MGRIARALLSLRAALAKIVLTVVALLGGASVGREGPTVQLAGAIMVQVHRLFRLRVTPGVVIAGGAAGVAAAFNTPLAGIAFAIEELAVAYEQRVAVLVMGAVMIAGLTAQGLAGEDGAALARQLRAGVFPGDLTLGAGGYGGTGTIATSSLSEQP